MNKQQIQVIEAEIEQLSHERSLLFNEWINKVKENDRKYELLGEDEPEGINKAADLLKQQRQINQKILQLLAKMDNVALKAL